MVNINDDNFKEEISKIENLVIVDFYADWCPPCNKLGPVLDKIASELSEDIALVKVNVDNFPKTASEFKVTKIPFVVLMDKGNIVDTFLGFKDEEDIKEWIGKNKKNDLNKDKDTNEENNDESVKDNEMNVDKELLMEYEDYANDNDFILNPDKKIVEGILKGLSRNEEVHGARYCPCRRITGNRREDKNIVCPCIYHKEEIEIDGKCMCSLFFKSE